ncbi:MAG: hypothetical protein ACRDRZ_17940 [Pseudonocardiaceae bacterium]
MVQQLYPTSDTVARRPAPAGRHGLVRGEHDGITTFAERARATRDVVAAHASLAEIRRVAAEHGGRLRFGVLPAPDYRAAFDSLPAGSAQVVWDLPRGTRCGACGDLAQRRILDSSGMLEDEHDGHGLGGWACATGRPR